MEYITTDVSLQGNSLVHNAPLDINNNYQEYNTIGPLNYTGVLPGMDNTTDNFYYVVENRIKNSKDSEKAVVLKDRLLKELQEFDESTIEDKEKENPLLIEFNNILKKFKEGIINYRMNLLK